MPKFLLVATTIFLLSFAIHPLHVSICEIEYDKDNKSLEIIQRIFVDDLEEAIRKDLKSPDLDITNPDNGKSTDELLKDYLQQKLIIAVNGKASTYKYLGHEIEGDAFFCYLEVEKVKKLRSLRLQSEILLALHEDQINIVHVKVNGENRSMKLSSHKRSEEFSY